VRVYVCVCVHACGLAFDYGAGSVVCKAWRFPLLVACNSAARTFTRQTATLHSVSVLSQINL